MYVLRLVPTILTAFFLAAPAHAASGGIVLPEPSGLFLLGIGVAGVVLGRKFSSKGGGE